MYKILTWETSQILVHTNLNEYSLLFVCHCRLLNMRDWLLGREKNE